MGIYLSKKDYRVLVAKYDKMERLKDDVILREAKKFYENLTEEYYVTKDGLVYIEVRCGPLKGKRYKALTREKIEYIKKEDRYCKKILVSIKQKEPYNGRRTMYLLLERLVYGMFTTGKYLDYRDDKSNKTGTFIKNIIVFKDGNCENFKFENLKKKYVREVHSKKEIYKWSFEKEEYEEFIKLTLIRDKNERTKAYNEYIEKYDLNRYGKIYNSLRSYCKKEKTRSSNLYGDLVNVDKNLIEDYKKIVLTRRERSNAIIDEIIKKCSNRRLGSDLLEERWDELSEFYSNFDSARAVILIRKHKMLNK